jgi:cysteine-rich CPCC protein
MLSKRKYTCPCCGYKTLAAEPPGTYDICDICFWEDDPLQFEEPDYQSGANPVCLRQAQMNFIKFGACEPDMIEHVRKPTQHDIKDSGWKPLTGKEQCL